MVCLIFYFLIFGSVLVVGEAYGGIANKERFQG